MIHEEADYSGIPVYLERLDQILALLAPSSTSLVVDYHALVFAAALFMARSRGVDLVPANLSLITEIIARAVIPVVEGIGE